MPGGVTGGTRKRRCRVPHSRDLARCSSEMTVAVLHADAGPARAARELCRRLAIVGLFDGTHIGGSLWRAATYLGIDTAKFDISDAGGGNRILRAALWRL